MSSVRAYIRVSSRAQDHAMQKLAIERGATARGDTIAHWYSEKQSAKTMNRPALQQLRADVRAGLVTKVYVFRLDRLSRTGVKDTFDLIEEFKAHNVSLFSVSDGMTFCDGSFASELSLAVLAICAKLERITINERISAARDAMENEGRDWGRPRRLSPNQEAQLLELRAKRYTVRELAMALKVPRSTVSDALKRLSGKAAPDLQSSAPLEKEVQGVLSE